MEDFKELKIVHGSTSEVWKILKSLKLCMGQFQRLKEFSAGPILSHFTRER